MRRPRSSLRPTSGARIDWSRNPLLPGWGSHWVVVERERLHVLRLEALNVAAKALFDADDPVRALALTAVRAEPPRESSWRLMITAHRDQGNLANVRRAYARVPRPDRP